MSFPDIYYYDHSGDTRSLKELAPLLGENRAGYCGRMKNVNAALNSAYAFLLLRYALKKKYGISAVPEFNYNEYGKPFLKDFPDIYFSMSHCAGRVVCAVSDSPIGVDIQDHRKLNMRTAEKFLTDNELAAVSVITDTTALENELCRLWCIKESYGKMTGKGFVEGFRSFEADSLINTGNAFVTIKDDCFISLCVKEK